MISLGFSFISTLAQENAPDSDEEHKIQQWIAYYERQLNSVWENLATTVADSYREFPPSQEQNMIALRNHMAAHRREMQIVEYIDELKSKLSANKRKCKRD